MCFPRIDVLFNNSPVRQSNSHTLIVQANLIDAIFIITMMSKMMTKFGLKNFKLILILN